MSLDLAPDIGGGIARLQWCGHDILRPSTEQTILEQNPCGLGEFPLVPFANRIAGGKIPTAGVHLARNTPGELNALHGVGWQKAWQVRELGGAADNAVVLALEHHADIFWPWHFTAERRFSLTESALLVSLSITNNSPQNMPVSLGFHPYFPRAECIVTASTKGRLEVDDTGIPNGDVSRLAVDSLERGFDPNATVLDHCFTHWNGAARLSYPTYAVEISAEACRFLQIYAPHDSDFVCIEPMSAMPDAFSRSNQVDAGAIWLNADPSQTFSVSMTIAICQTL